MRKIINELLLIMQKHFLQIQKDIHDRLYDFWKFKIPQFIINPFVYETSSADMEFLSKLLLLKNDKYAQNLFDSVNLTNFWGNQYIFSYYKILSEKALEYLIIYVDCYKIESGLGHLSSIYAKYRNCLELNNNSDLRLKTSVLKYNDLLSQKENKNIFYSIFNLQYNIKINIFKKTKNYSSLYKYFNFFYFCNMKFHTQK